MPNGEGADPFADNTRFGCLLIAPPRLSPQSVHCVIDDNLTITFLALLPIYPEEMLFKLRSGSNALTQLLDQANATELVNNNRPTVITV